MTDPTTSQDDMSSTGLVARVVQGFLLDALTNGAALLSLVVLVAGCVTQEPGWVAAGVVVGVVGTVLPWTGLARRWSDPVMWAVVLPVIVVDLAVLALIWKRA